MSRSDQNKSGFHGSGQEKRPAGADPHVTHTDLENRPEKDASPTAKIEHLRALIREGLESSPSELLDIEAIKRATRT